MKRTAVIPRQPGILIFHGRGVVRWRGSKGLGFFLKERRIFIQFKVKENRWKFFHRDEM